MSNEFISPNWHVILIHYPIALLSLGVLIELFSFLWRRSQFRAVGRWMLLMGAVLAVPSVLSGLYALNDVALMHIPADQQPMTWHEKVAAGGLSSQSWELLVDHLRQMSIATGIAMLVVVIWLACSDNWRRRLHLPLLIAMLASVGLMIIGGWHGGEAVYRDGAGVVSLPQPAASPAGHDWTYYLPPLQIHLLLAGLTVAMALVALGLSIRAAATGGSRIPPPPGDSLEAYAQRSATDMAVAFTGRPNTPALQEIPAPPPPRVPLARFWLLAFFIGLLTAAAGVWFLALDSGTWDTTQLCEIARSLQRRVAHIITGLSIIVLTLILCVLARWAPKQKFLLAIFAILLVAGITLQLWFGTLLLFDGPQGELTGFNKPEASMTGPVNIPTTLPASSTAPANP